MQFLTDLYSHQVCKYSFDTKAWTTKLRNIVNYIKI